MGLDTPDTTCHSVRLGHTDPAITLRVYAHVITEQAATAADVFAEALKSTA